MIKLDKLPIDCQRELHKMAQEAAVANKITTEDVVTCDCGRELQFEPSRRYKWLKGILQCPVRKHWWDLLNYRHTKYYVEDRLVDCIFRDFNH